MSRRRRDRDDEVFEDDVPSGPSKTQVKKQMMDLQALGEQLAKLPEAVLATIELDDSLRDALAELKRMKTFEAKRRQGQYVGKLMRDADADGIRRALAELKRGPAAPAPPAQPGGDPAV